MAWPIDSNSGWLTPVREAVVLDVVDPVALAQKAAQVLHPIVGMSFTGVAVREEGGLFAMHGVAGGLNETVLRKIRLSSGQGVGGKVVALRAPVLVTDYVTDPAITPHFRDLAVMESLGAMAAVPVIAEGEVTAIIYAATRDVSAPGDVGLLRLDQAAAGLADLFSVSVRHQDAVRRQTAADRLRIAEELHDTVGQMLFSIGSSARRLRLDVESLGLDGRGAGDVRPNWAGADGVGCDGIAADGIPADGLPTDPLEGLARLGEAIEGDAARAAAMLRQALGRLAPRVPEESLPVAARLGVEEFSRASGVPAHLVVMGDPRTLTTNGASALLNVLREALHNVAKHAAAGRVVVTLAFSAETVDLVIQDDGCGLPAGFALRACTSGGRNGFGLPSLLRRMQQLGGSLVVRPGSQGGTTLRASLREPAAKPAES